jgi:DNA repair protein RecO (recombination protein O)
MALIESEGFILNSKNVGDADRLITLLTIDKGVINLFAHNVRRAKSSLGGSLQPFARVAVCYTMGHSYSLRQCTVIESFRQLREDLLMMAYASVVAELIIQLWPEGEGDQLLYEITGKIFTLLGISNPRLVALAASWQLLSIAGFAPELTVCVHCGQVLGPADDFCRFAASSGGLACVSCATSETTALTSSALVLLKKLLALDLSSPGHFTVAGSDLTQVEKIFIDYLLCHSERPLKSLAFVHSIV